MKYNFTYQELYHALNNYHFELRQEGLSETQAIETKRIILKFFGTDRMKKFIERADKDKKGEM